MYILRDILLPLQNNFSDTNLGREGASLFVYTLLSIIIPFTSSITSNVWRCLDTLFGFEIKSKRFYTFMTSSTMLWKTVWGLIPSPETEGRILVALDDSISTKVGTKYCIGRIVETNKRTLGLLICRFPVLSAFKNNSGKKGDSHDER